MKKMMEQYCLLNNIRKDLLPMSYEYYVFLREQGVSKEDLRDAHFSIGDFEYYLTDDERKMMILDIISVLFSLKGNWIKVMPY